MMKRRTGQMVPPITTRPESRKALRQCPIVGTRKKSLILIDVRQFALGHMKAQHAIAEIFRKDIIHLQEQSFEKPDHKKERKRGCERKQSARPDAEKLAVRPVSAGTVSDGRRQKPAESWRNHRPSLRLPAPKKINHGKNQDLD